jgi:hypothetical protein
MEFDLQLQVYFLNHQTKVSECILHKFIVDSPEFLLPEEKVWYLLRITEKMSFFYELVVHLF